METLPAVQRSNGETILCYVRRPTEGEKARYSDEWKDMIFYGVSGAPSIELTTMQPYDLRSFKQATNRKTDGATPGYSNWLWLITQEEWDAIAAEDQQRKAQAQEAAQEEVRGLSPEEMEEETRLSRRYGTSEQAWDAGDERAWAILHAAEIRILTGRGGPGRGQGRKPKNGAPMKAKTVDLPLEMIDLIQAEADERSVSFADVARERLAKSYEYESE